MKKLLVLFLVLTICISAFFACGDSADTEEKSKSDGGNKETLSESTQEEASIDTEAPDSYAESVEDSEYQDGNSGSQAYPCDILEGLPYTITCKDKYSGEVVEYPFADEGKLNDGLYRSEADLENEDGEDMRVFFENTNTYNFVIVFEADGTHDGYRLVAHNCDFSFSFLKIEIGDDLDNMIELSFEDDFESAPNMHCDNFADFEVTTIKTVRITVTTGTSATTALDEISLLGFPMGEADKWLGEDTPPPAGSEQPVGDSDSLLIGTWGADDPEIVEKGGSDYKLTFTFVADGTGTYSQAGANLPFTWYSADSVLYMEMPLAGAMEKPYYFEGGNLYMNDEDGRNTKFVKLS